MGLIKMYQIEIDEEIYNYLKQNAEPFKDPPDTPNSVLQKLLKLNSHQIDAKSDDITLALPTFPDSVPSALAQILEMIILVKNKGLKRVKATHTVAKLRKISTQAVIDKYTRQLNKKAYEVDELLMTSNLSEFKKLLVERFPHHKSIVETVFEKVKP